MPATKSPDNLVESCRLLFGSDYIICRELLNHITPSDLNLAFSKELKSRLPQGATVSSLSKTFIAKKLKSLTLAYKMLIDHFESTMSEEDRALSAKLLEGVTSKERVVIPDSALPRQIPAASTALHADKGSSVPYRGTLPRTKLRFASFLYYKGVIDQKTLNAALQWQKQRRPLFGQIAVAWDIISLRDFAELLYHSKDGEPIGQVGKRRGKLSDKQIAALLTEQGRYRVQIGQYFIQKGILTEKEVTSYLTELEEHNGHYGA